MTTYTIQLKPEPGDDSPPFVLAKAIPATTPEQALARFKASSTADALLPPLYIINDVTGIVLETR